LKGTDYTLGTLTWIGDFADPLTFLQMWTSDSNLNDSRYADEEFEDYIKRSMSEGGEERYKTLSEAEQFLLSQGVVLPISHQPAWNVIDLSAIGGWYPNPLDIHPFKFLNFQVQKLPRGIARVLFD
jgi:peptide/nickel transport system substrate-binding protein/oligopeptide transport system substrate-binding protein